MEKYYSKRHITQESLNFPQPCVCLRKSIHHLVCTVPNGFLLSGLKCLVRKRSVAVCQVNTHVGEF